MEHDSSRSGYHEPEPGHAGLEDEEDWGDDFPKTFSVNLIWAQLVTRKVMTAPSDLRVVCRGICPKT